MNYWKLKSDLSETELRRAIPRLEALRTQLAAEIPAKDADDNLLLATWNLRDLGVPGGGFGHGERLPESYFYIAEVLSRFDFVAVQEVNELYAWEEVMDVLGRDWGFIASDVTEGASGNGERLTYLYDKRKVSFRNIAGEIVLQPTTLISKNAKGGQQFARTPYFASFQAGWRKFDICTVHIYYGSESGAKLERRIDEIQRIAKLLGARAKAATAAGKAMILLGDFNVVGLKHRTMEALVESGFEVPPAIQEPPTGKRNSYYDQIAFRTAPDALVFPDGKEEAGSFQVLQGLFTDAEIDLYRTYFEPLRVKAEEKARAEAEKEGKPLPGPIAPEAYYREWRTWQLSDHQPLWVRLKANDSDNYLKRLLETP
jgi:endonuclease/exonuclease/phosphatase family metal-dependent hydrolase